MKRCHRNNAQRPWSTEQISAAAETIGGNDDLVVEILQRLPVKSLIRFRSVSKTWLSLISSHRLSLLLWQSSHGHPKISGLFSTSIFKSEIKYKYIHLIDSELKNPYCNTSTCINNAEEEIKSLALFPEMNTSAIIEHSCNGFLLFRGGYYSNWRTYHVYNPTTRQFSTLPWPFPQLSNFPDDVLYLAFDPLKSLHYKVVYLQRSLARNNTYLCQTHIYSSETNAWRRSPPNIGDHHHHPFSAPTCVDFYNGVYSNGCIHWISFRLQPKKSIYFDVDQERFCPMPPLPYLAAFKFYHFGESRGHLHLIDYYDDTLGFNFNVYEMEGDYSKWSLKYQVGLNAMIVDLASKEEMVVRYDLVSVLNLIHGEDEEGDDVVLVLFVGTSTIISYNIKDNTFKKQQLGGDSGRHHHPVSSSHDLLWIKRSRVHRYIETLFPV